MKTLFVVLSLLFATAALGQTATVLSNYVQPVEIVDHPAHASQHDLAKPQDLLEHSDYTYAQGERPLSDFPEHPSEPAPLGDIARALRSEHLTARKAEFVFEKQGRK
jgi:hypothetical protein